VTVSTSQIDLLINQAINFFNFVEHYSICFIELQHAFKLYDKDKNGSMDAREFKQVLVDLGKRDVTDQ
jgi:Ca2+-binding EF-hand superfamily protein